MDRPQDIDTLATNLRATACLVNAEWKENKRNNGEDKHFEFSTNAVDFLGISFKKNQSGWEWKHLEGSINTWGKYLEQDFTWRLAAQMVGVLTWDWTISNELRVSRARIFGIARIIGSKGLMGKKWDGRPDSTLPLVERKYLREVFEGTLQNHWRTQRRSIPSNYEELCFVASDAMNTHGAVVWFDSQGNEESYTIIDFARARYRPSKDIAQGDLSINWKETFTALQAIELTAKKVSAKTHIRVGVDNTSAVAVINKRSVHWCETLDKIVLDLDRRLTLEDITFSAHYIPGTLQAADERSRGRESLLWKSKLFLERLTNTDVTIWENLNAPGAIPEKKLRKE